MIALASLVLVLSPFALLIALAWMVGSRRACFTDTVNRTMPVVDGVRQPPLVPPLEVVSFHRVVRRAIAHTHGKLQGESE